MSVSEWEQKKSAHHERRMVIMNEIHDIISISGKNTLVYSAGGE